YDEHARYAFLPNCNRLRARCHQYAVARLSAQAVWPAFHDNDSDSGGGTQPLAHPLTAEIGDGGDGDEDFCHQHEQDRQQPQLRGEAAAKRHLPVRLLLRPRRFQHPRPIRQIAALRGAFPYIYPKPWGDGNRMPMTQKVLPQNGRTLLKKRETDVAACGLLLLRSDHLLRAHKAIIILFGNEAALQGFLAQRRAVLVRRLRDHRRIIVADCRRKRGDQHQRLLHQVCDANLVRLDALDAIVGEGAHGVRQKPNRLQRGVGNHRLEDVELEVALAGSNGDDGLVAHDLRRNHRRRPALGRTDLARHARRVRLIFRQLQFAKARTRAGAEETDVIGDLEEIGRKRIECAVERVERAVACQRLELVLSRAERQAGDGGYTISEILVEADRRVEAGADGGTALRKRVDIAERCLDAHATKLQSSNVTGELLAER